MSAGLEEPTSAIEAAAAGGGSRSAGHGSCHREEMLGAVTQGLQIWLRSGSDRGFLMAAVGNGGCWLSNSHLTKSFANTYQACNDVGIGTLQAIVLDGPRNEGTQDYGGTRFWARLLFPEI